MKRQLQAAMISVLLLSGLFAIGLGTTHESHSYTHGTQQITDVRFGLASSPVYTSHREEPVGGAISAIDRRQERVGVVVERRWNWLSWSFLLVLFGIGAITWSLVKLVRMPKREDRPH